MRIDRFLPPLSAAVSLGVCALLLSPERGESYTMIGSQLELRQRDFRVFNNFSDASANDNQSHDPDFPGATGAVLAVWKAVAEWGSAPHGTGYGDPSQDAIGSGESNFDAHFQGLATGPGGLSDNVFSELDAFGGGVLAFTELPAHDGWRIRFYKDPHEWHDGPGLVIGGFDSWDIQGIACHEYGHALGLGHSAAPGATMGTTTQGMGYDLRSIEADDRAGVQFLYGPRSPVKPLIESYELTPTSVVLHGQNFDATDNEVWFTRRVGGDGHPVRVSGLASTLGGTRLSVSVPPLAGQGDVLVKLPGMAYSALSNAFPFDPAGPPCVLPVAYGTPKVTSFGTVPAIEWRGFPSATLGSFEIGTFGGTVSSTGLLFSGPASASLPFAGGTLYVGGPIRREARFQFNAFEALVSVPITADMLGMTRFYQLWFRDAGDAFGVGLSNGLEVFFCL